MKTITIEVPDDLSLPASDEEIAREFRLAAAVEWYREGRVSQGKGAEIAGLSRADFLDALSRASVSACQETLDDLAEVWDRAVSSPDRGGRRFEPIPEG
jgi:predicted HTH domain antitoxin